MKTLFAVLLLLAVLIGNAQAQTPSDLVIDVLRPINLQWKDNATNEDGFVVERRLNAGVWAPLAVGTAGANITSLSDSTLIQDDKIDNRYCYRVRAFNSAGASGYTNEACAVVKRKLPADPSELILSLQQALKALLEYSALKK